MTREYGELRSELGKVKEVVTNISSQVDTESQAVPQRYDRWFLRDAEVCSSLVGVDKVAGILMILYNH